MKIGAGEHHSEKIPRCEAKSGTDDGLIMLLMASGGR